MTDKKNNTINLVDVRIEVIKTDVIVTLSKISDNQDPYWYYSTIREVNHTLMTAILLGNHTMMVAWLKDNLNDVCHKRINFIKGPNILKLWATKRDK